MPASTFCATASCCDEDHSTPPPITGQSRLPGQTQLGEADELVGRDERGEKAGDEQDADHEAGFRTYGR